MMQMRRGLVLVVTLFALGISSAEAQQQQVIFQDANAPAAAAAPVQGAPAYTQQQLDQMLAPVALYPDALVGQILMASTYPLEVVEAHRWLQNQQNAALKGDQLAAALQGAPWDPSVKSLVPFPQVLNMMDSNLQWTEQLGDAFLANQAGVMDTVQHLRQMAQSAGHLSTTPQETVSTEGSEILIEPAAPQTVYIPYYDPSLVYGVWPYPSYPPYYFPAPPGYVFYPGIIGFGVGLVVLDAFWGWNHWDWRNHHIDIDEHRWAAFDTHRAIPASGVWQHDPDHRHGVPYHSAAARAQFGAASAQARTNFRGFSARAASASPAAAQVEPASRTTSGRNAASSRAITPQTSGTPQAQTRATTEVTSHQPPAQFQHASHTAPVFESFSRGQEVHTQSQRGATSLATMHAAPAAAHAAPAASHSGGGHENETRHP